jgi:DNA-binding transcriptional LysR family regulator
VSQSALSQTVSALEREIGVQLLERTSTGVRPTEAGATLFEEARAVLARYHQAVRTMGRYRDEASGVIRLRSHGIDIGPAPADGHVLIAAVKLTSVSAGDAFALAPEDQLRPLPDKVTWAPLVGRPLVRRTWVVWPADSRRRDIGQLVASLELPDTTRLVTTCAGVSND